MTIQQLSILIRELADVARNTESRLTVTATVKINDAEEQVTLGVEPTAHVQGKDGSE